MSTLIKPIITEKSMYLASQGVFTFQIQKGASKHEVKHAVESIFGVVVTNITTTTVKKEGKKTGRKRLTTNVAPVKFARVTLKSGQNIALFDLKEEN